MGKNGNRPSFLNKHILRDNIKLIQSVMADSGTNRLKERDTLTRDFALKHDGFSRDHECPATIRRGLKRFGDFSRIARLVHLVGVNDLGDMFPLLRQSKLPKRGTST